MKYSEGERKGDLPSHDSFTFKVCNFLSVGLEFPSILRDRHPSKSFFLFPQKKKLSKLGDDGPHFPTLETPLSTFFSEFIISYADFDKTYITLQFIYYHLITPDPDSEDVHNIQISLR